MFNLDPGKLIVIGVVAIILLGPDKLPQFARQVGGAWRTFNEFRHRMESEVRSTMPDLPPTSEIARLARSPSALLNHLSSMAPEEESEAGEAAGAAEGAEGAEGAGGAEGTGAEAPDGSFQPPVVTANGTGDVAGGAGAGASGTAVSRPAPAGGHETAPPATNGRSAVAPQPTEVAIPADPTLN
ncbi:MAG TPA: twin-arginine translocase TatA/TatE family subunit [Acidimicrobiales bacterium]|jgi:sec-independent protein translocase protein TatB|nr:twin-arginine translocase TatA/TatE family subunit [Acidimicrobiales bacterium]